MKRVNIYVDKLVFVALDYVLSITSVLETYNVQCHIIIYTSRDEFPQLMEKHGNDIVHIFLQRVPVSITSVLHQAYTIYLFNIEQMTRGNIYTHGYYNHHVDYSLENIELIHQHLPRPMPIYHIPYQYRTDEIYNYNKTGDVCFIGLAETSPRRQNVLQEIRNRGINLTLIENLHFHERDEVLLRHKILVNIHYHSSYNIHEHIRTDRCIYNKMIVVSEPSLDICKIPLHDFIVFETCENIPDKLVEILANYDAYYNRMFNDICMTKMTHIIETSKKQVEVLIQ